MGGEKSRTLIGAYFLVTSSLCFTRAYYNTDTDDRSWLLHRTRRDAAYCEDKYKLITEGHSACLGRSSLVTARGVIEEEQRLIVDMHNTARREVSPTAKDMQLMSWDDEVANTAQRYAENCYYGHDESYKRYAFGRFSVGQNLAMGSHLTWRRALQLWIDERDDFILGGPNTKMVGHYTQMVWAKSVKVGCGYAYCDDPGRDFHYFVCNYGPGGNSGGVNDPYSPGTTCGDCLSRCTNGLCDCGGKVCLNGGSMDLNSCTCSCKDDLPFFVQPDCALNCTHIEDPWYCAQWTGKCERFTNVPQQCPKMCNWCPYAGKDYGVEPSRAPVTSSLSAAPLVLAIFTCLFCLF